MELRCSHCGAEIPIEAKSDFVRCAYCEAALYVELDRTILHYRAEPSIRQADVPGLLERKLASLEIATLAEQLEVALVLFPFWRKARRARQPVIAAAVAPPVTDLTSATWTDVELVFFGAADAERFLVVAPGLLGAMPVAERTELLEASLAVEERLALVHVPIYEVSYTAAAQRYFAVVSGLGGEVFADEWPPSASTLRTRALGQVAVLALAAFGLESVFIPNFWLLLVAYAATAAAIYTLGRQRMRAVGGSTG